MQTASLDGKNFVALCGKARNYGYEELILVTAKHEIDNATVDELFKLAQRYTPMKPTNKYPYHNEIWYYLCDKLGKQGLCVKYDDSNNLYIDKKS
jgi:hypothetical protein